VGETVEVGNFDPKIATFWIESGKSFLQPFLTSVPTLEPCTNTQLSKLTNFDE